VAQLVQLHLFNHNQGNVAAAKAQVEMAQQELQRVDLMLRDRFAATLQGYRNAQIIVQRYQDEILPRAQQAYEFMVGRYGLMTASYPQVLSLQRALYQTEMGYISALATLRTKSVVLQGILLAGGLEMPGQAGEIDLGMIPEMGNSTPVRPSGMDSSMER
jgi:outer membrane protein, heavy metal efflux system